MQNTPLHSQEFEQTGGIFANFVQIIRSVIDSEVDEKIRIRKELMADEKLINNFRGELK